jgi:hypothetical protein
VIYTKHTGRQMNSLNSHRHFLARTKISEPAAALCDCNWTAWKPGTPDGAGPVPCTALLSQVAPRKTPPGVRRPATARRRNPHGTSRREHAGRRHSPDAREPDQPPPPATPGLMTTPRADPGRCSRRGASIEGPQERGTTPARRRCRHQTSSPSANARRRQAPGRKERFCPIKRAFAGNPGGIGCAVLPSHLPSPWLRCGRSGGGIPATAAAPGLESAGLTSPNPWPRPHKTLNRVP